MLSEISHAEGVQLRFPAAPRIVSSQRQKLDWRWPGPLEVGVLWDQGSLWGERFRGCMPVTFASQQGECH